MDDFITNNITTELIFAVIGVLILLWLLWGKYGADIKNTINHNDRVISDINSLKEWKNSVDEKLNRDYESIKRLERDTRQQEERITESLEEREIIMRATLATLKGLQELGANGETKSSQREIEDYLTRKAHR